MYTYRNMRKWIRAADRLHKKPQPARPQSEISSTDDKTSEGEDTRKPATPPQSPE